MKEFAKTKTATKAITYSGKALKSYVLNTLERASNLVGSTLGPNGKMVLIERQENLPPFLTKDGITVFNSMAFMNPTEQAILEAARDSSSKTNVEAGDGTTTATVLAEALTRLGFEYLDANPKISAQKVMREMESAFDKVVLPFIQEKAIKISEGNENDLLHKVAMIASNSDLQMADAVTEAFRNTGHGGNITILETPGTSGYGTEKIEGFPIARGFEDSCGRFLEEFITDKPNYRTTLEKPKFILYNGKLETLSKIDNIIRKVGVASSGEWIDDFGVKHPKFTDNIVIMAHHFSDQMKGYLAANMRVAENLKVIPLITPMTYQANSQYHFLLDVAAFTGATVFDPISKPLESGNLSDLGLDSIDSFEYYRYKSIILGTPDELLVIQRAEELEQQMKHEESSMDREILNERCAILTQGIARINVYGSSEAELKEKKHRVEDAVAAIKGALKYGVLPGCAKTLLVLGEMIKNDSSLSEAVKTIMGQAFKYPYLRILTNGGLNQEEVDEISKRTLEIASDGEPSFFYTYDALNHRFGDAIELGVIDSAAAVQMAIKNSLSVSKMLMCLSGVVVFGRDLQLERDEALEGTVQQALLSDAERKANWDKWEPPV
jgi:chaperonin GroEL